MTMQRTVKLDKLPEVISSFLFHKPFKGSKPCQSLSQTKPKLDQSCNWLPHSLGSSQN